MYGRPRKEAPTDSKRRRFFPFDLPLLTNFSGISTSFVHAIGRSTSSVDLPRPATSIGPGPGAPGPLVAYAPQRYSAEGLASELSVYEHMRDFRSPTPGSAHGLLAMRNTPSPDPSVRDHGPARISFETSTLPSRSNSLDEDPPRPSFTSCSSTSHAPALVGGAAVQRALAAEMRASGPRSTSSRSSVELSHREARAAIIRIGGHFLSSLLSIALLAPFLARRIASPTGVPSLALSILFVVSVTLPAPVLALQVALVEGVWPSPQPQPTESAMSSSTTLADDAMETIKDTEHQHEHARCDSCASASAASLVSIDTVGLAGASSQDVETGTKSRFHRAVSTLSTHPRLMRLDEDATQESYAGASSSLHNGPGFAGSHARRRSVASTHSRTRTESALSQRSVFSTRVRRNTLSGSPRRDSPGCQPPTEEREGSELRISPDYTIDFLSSRVLPRLVPSVRLGADTPIEPEESSFTRRTSLGNDLGPLAPEGRPQSAAGITIFNGSTFGRRNFRNLSLPGIGSARRSLVSEGVQDFEAPNDATATPRPPSALATAASASPSIDIPDAATEAIARALLARRSEAPSKLDDARQTAQGNADQSEILAPTSSSEEAPQTRAGFVPRELRLSRSSSVTSRSARLSTYSSMSSYDDEDPAELGTIHCATIHSVSRPQSALPANSTSHHSLNSRSDDTLEQGAGRPRSHSSITSQGFRNTMRTGRASTIERLSACSQLTGMLQAGMMTRATRPSRQISIRRHHRGRPQQLGCVVSRFSTLATRLSVMPLLAFSTRPRATRQRLVQKSMATSTQARQWLIYEPCSTAPSAPAQSRTFHAPLCAMLTVAGTSSLRHRSLRTTRTSAASRQRLPRLYAALHARLFAPKELKTRMRRLTSRLKSPARTSRGAARSGSTVIVVRRVATSVRCVDDARTLISRQLRKGTCFFRG